MFSSVSAFLKILGKNIPPIQESSHFLFCLGFFVLLFVGVFLWLLCCNAITSDKGQQGCFSEMLVN